jgi:hypothetical protein
MVSSAKRARRTMRRGLTASNFTHHRERMSFDTLPDCRPYLAEARDALIPSAPAPIPPSGYFPRFAGEGFPHRPVLNPSPVKRGKSGGAGMGAGAEGNSAAPSVAGSRMVCEMPGGEPAPRSSTGALRAAHHEALSLAGCIGCISLRSMHPTWREASRARPHGICTACLRRSRESCGEACRRRSRSRSSCDRSCRRAARLRAQPEVVCVFRRRPTVARTRRR